MWRAVEEGRDGTGPVGRFPTDEFGVNLGAKVAGNDDARLRGDTEAVTALGLACARGEIRAAGWQAAVDDSGVRSDRIALVLGSSPGPGRGGLHELCEKLADELGAGGPRIVVSTACSSSTTAMGLAGDLLHDSADLVVAAGTDVLGPEVFSGFHSLGVMCPEKCAPFSLPVGMTLGEGAGCAIIEPREQAERRGVRPLAVLLGYGTSGDAYHETTPDPSGTGIARAIASALRDAGIAPGDVGYVKAHGSGTAANDQAEWRALQRVFGAYATVMPVSSLKGALGHAQGAAGILEIVVALLALQRGVVPPTLHHGKPRPFCPPDPVAGSRPRSADVRHAVCVNSAFGGANAAVVLSRPGAVSPERPRRPLWILGAGAVGPHGHTLESLAEALRADKPLARRTPPVPLAGLVPTADPRDLDPASVFLTAAAAAALRDAGIGLHGSGRERYGLIVGTTRVSAQSAAEFRCSIDERGLAGLSVRAFARIVLNASAGACSKVLALKGPHTAITTGRDSGLAALVAAAGMASRRDDVDLIVAGGVDELPLPEDGEGLVGEDGLADGAACVVVGPATVHDVEPWASPVRLAGWAVAGPGRTAEAVERALRMAGVGRDEVDLWYGGDPFDRASDGAEWSVAGTPRSTRRGWSGPPRRAGDTGVRGRRPGSARGQGRHRAGDLRREPLGGVRRPAGGKREESWNLSWPDGWRDARTCSAACGAS